jgi:hypothetical protein
MRGRQCQSPGLQDKGTGAAEHPPMVWLACGVCSAKFVLPDGER